MYFVWDVTICANLGEGANMCGTSLVIITNETLAFRQAHHGSERFYVYLLALTLYKVLCFDCCADEEKCVKLI